jgi:hypothetical protein
MHSLVARRNAYCIDSYPETGKKYEYLDTCLMERLKSDTDPTSINVLRIIQGRYRDTLNER